MNDVCNICLNPVRSTRSTRELGCGHRFHTQCIDCWTEPTCPVCRRNTNALNKYKVTISIENNHTSNILEESNLSNSVVLSILSQFFTEEPEAMLTEIDIDFATDQSIQNFLETIGFSNTYTHSLISDT